MNRLKRALTKIKRFFWTTGRGRWLRISVASVVFISICIPALTWIDDSKSYALSPAVEKVLGNANKNLSAKFSFDTNTNKWQFNKDGAAAQAANIAKQQGQDAEGVAGALAQLRSQQLGGGGKEDQSLYSVDLPAKSEQGITYYDNQSNLSFKMVPTFPTRDAKLIQDRIVYPFAEGGQIVYTAKTNGLKEDIVLSKYIGDSLRYGYTLELPGSLEAKMQEDGSIGVYSADPSLFGNISFGNDDDKAKVMDARKNAPKNHLAFGIPAPYIKDQNGRKGQTKYVLDGTNLSVIATGLKSLSYPLAIDPSVTITTSNDFKSGNNEGMIDFDTSDQIKRKGLTGGTVSSWNFTDNSVNRGTTQNPGSGSASGLITARDNHGSVTYNGYIYVLGGDDTSGGFLSSVERAPINSDGTIGTWLASGDLPEGRVSLTAAAYNGYMYIAAGYVGGSNFSADVKYAPINSDGSLGTWAATTSIPVGRTEHGMAVYNGKMYIINGCTNQTGQCNNASPTAVAYCADINANGTVGAWSSCNTTNLTGRYGHAITAYNGFIYMAGGCQTNSLFACTVQPTTVQYTKINADGSLGDWLTTTSSFTGPRQGVVLLQKDGYLYFTGGSTNNYANDVQYAPVFANGNLGNWQATSSFITARSYASMVAYGNNIYITGGCVNFSASCTVFRNDVQFSVLNSAGALGSFSSGGTFTTNRQGAQAVAYNGKLYVMGGFDGGGTPTDTVYSATINSDGTIGSFSSNGNMDNRKMFFGAAAYNGYMYVTGGCTTAFASCTTASNNNATVYKSAIAADGTLGAWTAQTSFTTARYGHSAVAYNGVMYVMGGINGSTFQNNIQYHSIAENGDISGAWTTSAQTIPTARAYFGAQVAGNKLYIIGGCSAGALTCTSTLSDSLYAPVTSGGDLTSGLVTTGNGTAFTNSRGMHGLSIYNGLLYMTGGMSNGTYYGDTQHASINSDGSVGNWASSPSVLVTAPLNRAGIGSVAYNGYLYITGGYNGTTYSNNVQIASINNGGNGDTGAWTNNATSFTTARMEHSSVAYNGYIYVLGGASLGGSPGANTVMYAPINADGSVGSWNTTSLYSGASVGQVLLAYQGNMYKVGGQITSGAMLNDVQYAPINANGTLGTWNYTFNNTSSATNPTNIGLNTARFDFSTVAYNGNLYAMGGCTAKDLSSVCTTFTNSVEYAPINANGTVGSWTAASAFSTSRMKHAGAAYGGYIYVAGGCTAITGLGNDCLTFADDVQYSKLNSNGTLASDSGCGVTWCKARSFMTGRHGLTMSAINGYMYISGGNSSSAVLGDVQYAAIQSNGTIGAWTKSTTSLTSTSRRAHSTVIYNGRLYVTGGCSITTRPCGAGSFLGDTQYSSINTISRIGRYSKLVQVPSAIEVSGVYFNGTVGPGSTVTYKVAPSSGVFDTTGQAIQGSGSEPTPLCGAGTIFYVQITVTLDDSQVAVYSDASSTSSALTDTLIYYRVTATPPPNLRLNGGKWFNAESQYPLDICRL